MTQSTRGDTIRNKHDTPRTLGIAENGLIYKTHVGSGLLGLAIGGTDDIDHMGVCIEPPGCVIGLDVFEQHQSRLHVDGTPIPEGQRSGPGDTDYVAYSLRKFARLAAQGNPTVLISLWAPPDQVLFENEFGAALRSDPAVFLSREAGLRFAGYLESQKSKLLGERSQRTNRPELKDKYGFDTKFAYHAVRLGVQGLEILTTGSLNLPMAEPGATWLRELRVGMHTLEETIDKISELQYLLRHLITSADLPQRCDMTKVNKLLVELYLDYWTAQGLAQSDFELAG